MIDQEEVTIQIIFHACGMCIRVLTCLPFAHTCLPGKLVLGWIRWFGAPHSRTVWTIWWTSVLDQRRTCWLPCGQGILLGYGGMNTVSFFRIVPIAPLILSGV